jgi:hypothetical protein
MNIDIADTHAITFFAYKRNGRDKKLSIIRIPRASVAKKNLLNDAKKPLACGSGFDL